MNEQNTGGQQSAFTMSSERPPNKGLVDVFYTGKDNKGLEAAKEILIASFVKKMITKGKYDDIQ